LGVPFVPRVRLSAAIFFPSTQKPDATKGFPLQSLTQGHKFMQGCFEFFSLYGFLALQFIHANPVPNTQSILDGSISSSPFSIRKAIVVVSEKNNYTGARQ
jgi:hypothetical protein